MTRLFVPVLLLALAVAACAPTRQWVKEGSNSEDLRRDRNECGQRAEDYGFNDDPGWGPGRGTVRGDAYSQCMERRGWHRERMGSTRP